ncbi:hypothetical protein HAHE_05440 [Haloferula helveola]|uniref:Right handed beta helix domain-containing protein n=1 Tax=Haloferula helveola TaxID=490095 RepID=A0ABN6GZD1_9BACT|nr:hypothetical protein HAHE_05440 [Haloferula helveola]
MNKLALAVTGLTVSSILVAQSADTARIHVDAAADPGGDGSTWELAFQDLQSALAAAALTTSDDEIWVAQGTYTPDPGGTDRTKSFVLLNGVAIYGGFSGSESDLSARNPDPETNGTVLSGDLLGDDAPGFTNVGDNSYQVVTGTGTDASAVLDGLTIRGGNANSFPQNRGGGLVCINSGSPTINHCMFTANKSGQSGGAVSLSTLSPGVCAPVFTGCRFVGNETSTYGGAVDSASSLPEFIDCQFDSNYSGYYGGAFFNYASSSRFERCMFRGNSAGQNGGALYFNNSGTAGPPVLFNSTLSGNQARFGSAYYAISFATPVFTNVTITGNRGTEAAGSACYHSTNSNPALNNCVIWNNSAAGATNVLAASVTNFNSTPSFSHSIVANTGGSTSWNATAGSDLGGNLDADPVFTTPTDPATAPTTTGDLRLGSGSAAANAGLNSADLDGSGLGTETIADILTDLAGNDRIQNVTVDLGAYEGIFVNTQDSFTSLFPALSTSGDENGNGLSNFLDYALGADPTLEHDSDAMPAINGHQLVFSHRTNASDVTPVYKMSSTLGGWTTMVPGVDYSVSSTTTTGSREVVTLQLLIDTGSNPRMFFVQEFPEP